MKTKNVVKSILFVPLAKVDEANRTVTGVVTAEVLDKSGETMHYESSVPYFKAWSDGFDKVTKGKSKGNVRAMHQPVAVGKLTDIQYDDVGKTITATAKIIDDAEWEKVQEGVYTGFSIGGKYIKQWDEGEDANKVTYFTADPVEVSIVDNPCVPVAHFKMAKADGTEVEVDFQLYEPSNEEIAEKASHLATSAGEDAGQWVKFLDKARDVLKAEHGMPAEKAIEGEDDEELTDEEKAAKKLADEEAEKAALEEEEEEEDAEKLDPLTLVKQQWVATDGTPFDKKADCVEYQAGLDDPVKAALAAANSVLKGDEPEDQGELFPTDNELSVRAAYVKAVQAIYDTDEAKAEAIEAAKAAWVDKIGREPPSPERIEAIFAQKADEAVGEVLKGYGDVELQKGMYRIREWASAIDAILWATNWCGDYENDDEPLYASMKDICIGLLTFMLEFVDHEVGEMIAGFDKAEKVEGALAKVLLGAASSKPVEKGTVADLQKKLDAATERSDKLEKQVSEAVDGIKSLTNEIQSLKDQPEPRRHPSGVAVSKETDRSGVTKDDKPATEDDLKALIKEHGADKVSAMLIKIAQTQPVKMLE